MAAFRRGTAAGDDGQTAGTESESDDGHDAMDGGGLPSDGGGYQSDVGNGGGGRYVAADADLYEVGIPGREAGGGYPFGNTARH